MIRGKVILLKDKQAFKNEQGMLGLIGKPIEIAKDAKEEGFSLVHLIDLDARRGLATNFDIYDKLTYSTNIEVEGVKDEVFIEKLLEINARVVIELPTGLDLKKWKEKAGFLVVKLKNVKDIKAAEAVRDVILEKPNDILIAELRKLKKRIIVYKKDYEKIKNKRAVFLVLEE